MYYRLAMSAADVATPVIETTLDFDRVVFAGDRALRSELLAYPEIRAALQQNQQRPERQAMPLRACTKLTNKIAPDVFASVERCKQVLGIRADIEIYSEPSQQLNAFVWPLEGGRVLIRCTHLLLERLDPTELSAVIGHELGHVLFNHHALMIRETAALSPAVAIRFYAWRRYAEITADRVGLLCCDDLRAAIRGEFKSLSGLFDSQLLQSLEQSIAQFTEIKTTTLASDEIDWFSTHPCGPLRVTALGLFHRSHSFHSLLGRSGGDLDDVALETEVTAILDLMNPVALSQRLDCQPEVREFLKLGGAAIALSDQSLRFREMVAVGQLLAAIDSLGRQNHSGPGQFLPERILSAGQTLGKTSDGFLAARDFQRLSTQDLLNRLGPVTDVLNQKLTLNARRRLLEDLAAVAVADQQLSPEETTTLRALAGWLQIDPAFVEGVVQRLHAELD